MNVIRDSFDASIVNHDEILYLDTETDGLYGQVQMITLYQECWGEDVHAIRTHKWDSIKIIEFIMGIKHDHVIGHNLTYDMSCLNWVPEHWDCTFLAGRLEFFTLASFSLDSMLHHVLGYDPYEQAGIEKKETAKSNYGGLLLTNTQWTYASLDVYHLPTLWKAIKHQTESLSYKLDHKTVITCQELEKPGMPVNQEALEVTYTKLLEENKELASKLPDGLNVQSYKQVRAALGNIDESSEVSLLLFAADPLTDVVYAERAKNILAKRKVMKLLSFINKFDDDVVRGHFAPNTKSGRMKSDKENLQQLPRKLKHIFGYPEGSDRVLIYADYASLEMRTICAILGDPKMMKIMNEDGDLHTYTGQFLFGKTDITDEEREIAKVCNFLLLYGGQDFILKTTLLKWTGILYSNEQIKAWIKGWTSLYATIGGWQRDAQKLFWTQKNKRHTNVTPFGRNYSADRIQDYLNIINQGAGADVAKLAMNYMKRDLPALNEKLSAIDKTFMVNMVHDSFTLSAPNKPEAYIPGAKLVAECMSEAWHEASKKFNYEVVMPVTASVGFNWKDVDKKPHYSYVIDYQGNRSFGYVRDGLNEEVA